jgi:hypothetical protein
MKFILCANKQCNDGKELRSLPLLNNVTDAVLLGKLRKVGELVPSELLVLLYGLLLWFA